MSDILDFVEVDTYDGVYGVMIYPNDTISWKMQSDFFFGFCFTLELPLELTEQVVRKITIRTRKK